MKLAISSLAWKPGEDRAIAAVMRHFGLKGVELVPTKIWPDLSEAPDKALQQYRRFWNEEGFEIVSLQAILFGKEHLNIFESDETRKQCVDYFRHIFRVGQILGANVLIFGAIKNRLRQEPDNDKETEIALKLFSQLGTLAKSHGLCLAIEPLPPQYGCNFITSSSEGLDLVKRVNTLGFGLHLDAAAMYLKKEEIVASLKEAKERIAHFHISEPYLAPITNKGEVDFALYLRTLREIGYPNWCSIEMKEPSPKGSNIEAVQEALAFVTESIRATES